MAHALLITVRLHDDRYHGRRADGIEDWPPSPARLFQALIASAGLSGPNVLEEYSSALTWLEGLAPPSVMAPRAVVGQEFKTYVPQNDLDAYGGRPQRIGKVRTAKIIQPHCFKGDLAYAWEFSDSVDAKRNADAICALAERLYQFGRSEDMAWAWGEVLSDVELDERLRGYPGLVYRPSGGGRGTLLLCPTHRSLESLKERYRASSRRFIPAGMGRSAQQTLRQPPKPRFVQVAYESPTERFVYTLRDSDGRSFRPRPLGDALPLTQAIRDGMADKLRGVYPSQLAEIEKVVIGRKANGADDGPLSERVRIIPLPSIGHEYADRDIRRVLVEVPAQRWFRADDISWALSGLAIPNPDIPDATSFLTPSPNDPMLRHYGVPQAARRWHTVTPAALPGWIWRGIDRMRAADDTKNAAARILREHAAEAVIKTLRFSSVRARVESVQVQREPFDSGGEPADAFEAGTRFDKGRLWHLEITFESPVEGPLVVGDGRFMGLGVMAPSNDQPESSSGAAGVAFVTPHAVSQFQERVASLPYNQALAAILHSLNTASPPRPTENGAAVYVRTRVPYQFRAIVRPPASGRRLPAVVTILKG